MSPAVTRFSDERRRRVVEELEAAQEITAAMAAAGEDVLATKARAAHLAGLRWEQVGDVLGISGATAWRRFSRRAAERREG